MIKIIRPHQVFDSLVTKNYYERLTQVVIPDKDLYRASPILLEIAILLALVKIVKPKKYFEFGTYLGTQTLAVALALGRASTIYTLDLDKNCFSRVRQNKADRVVSNEYLKRRHKMAFWHTPMERKIVPLYGDSNKFQFSPFEKKMDMVFIDGGHDLRTVRSDTLNAFKMLRPNSFSAIVWHDYGNAKYPGVKKQLEEIARHAPLYSVAETLICFYLNHAPKKIIRHL